MDKWNNIKNPSLTGIAQMMTDYGMWSDRRNDS